MLVTQDFSEIFDNIQKILNSLASAGQAWNFATKDGKMNPPKSYVAFVRRMDFSIATQNFKVYKNDQLIPMLSHFA